MQQLLPQHLLSRIIGKIANSKIKWLKNLFIKIFILVYKKIDLTEAIEINPFNYASFNDFFTRALKPGARTIASDENIIISPADGVIAQFEQCAKNKLITAKNFDFSLTQLLGNEQIAESFNNGHFITIYLAPHNYHRVHMPCHGILKTMLYIPGKLFSVNKKSVTAIPNVYARNERLVTIFDTGLGPVAIILIGALIVGSIETTWAGTIIPNAATTSPAQIMTWNYEHDDIKLSRGAELGRFKLGSTVIMLFPPGKVALEPLKSKDSTVQMGEIVGKILY
jgi:phosphatidylserine decarboxylase